VFQEQKRQVNSCEHELERTFLMNKAFKNGY
jgi:hypothetical protein